MTLSSPFLAEVAVHRAAPVRDDVVPMFHVTLLSNLARAYDKYQGAYRKSAIPESRYPEVFHLLTLADLSIGIDKAERLRARSATAGDRLIVLRAELPRESLQPNLRNGIGLVWPSPDLPLAGLHEVAPDGGLGPQVRLEEAMARSLALHADAFLPWDAIRPRSVSFLPIARGCQAKCPFCFSEASASVEQPQARIDWAGVDQWVQRAQSRGAERAVITGGGEPTLMKRADLLQLVRACRARFDKVVLITNGVALAGQGEAEAAEQLMALHEAGLGVLAVSRHHVDEAANAALMKIATQTPVLLRARRDRADALQGLRMRLVCVLQRGGVDSVQAVDDYVRWAAGNGADEVCFKELYVSTSEESVWFAHGANEWSARHQVPLSLVHRWAETAGFQEVARLPWGAPVYGGSIAGREMRVAAYTEPSLFWERRNGTARSWNVMADGTCLASLEDRTSLVGPGQAVLCA
ncbi:radical SAM protein [Roseateles chitinivorans]|uniref:radical SAM protein n=1 Tax=Roseateles chitinivorans TaxID=2917965 RepID=UPI003D66A45C